jgi:hypothetical protein
LSLVVAIEPLTAFCALGDKCVLAFSQDRKKIVKFNPFHIPFEIMGQCDGMVSSILANIDNDHVLVHLKPRNPYTK